MGSLENQVALVTGGSRGIGKAVCLMLAKEGAFVYVNYSSNEQKALDVVKEIKDAGGDAKALGFRVQEKQEVENAINQIKEEKGKIDIENVGRLNKDALSFTSADELSVLDIQLDMEFVPEHKQN